MQMKEDTKFFDETKVACKTNADHWSERTRLRTEELAGINKALELLTSEDARAPFNKAVKQGKEAFLQLNKDISGPEAQAFKALKKQATKACSLRLAFLAASICTANAWNS